MRGWSRCRGCRRSGQAAVRAVEIPAGVHPNDAYLVLQTVVGAWPLTPRTARRVSGEGAARGQAALELARARCRVRAAGPGLRLGAARVAREGSPGGCAPLGEQIALAQTLLKLTCPGVPDIYQGDEGGASTSSTPTTGGRSTGPRSRASRTRSSDSSARCSPSGSRASTRPSMPARACARSGAGGISSRCRCGRARRSRRRRLAAAHVGALGPRVPVAAIGAAADGDAASA